MLLAPVGVYRSLQELSGKRPHTPRFSALGCFYTSAGRKMPLLSSVDQISDKGKTPEITNNARYFDVRKDFH